MAEPAAAARVVALFGPTGMGKSEIAVALAESLDAEIVSADSMQLYRGLPIVTNQPSGELLARCSVGVREFADVCAGCEGLATSAAEQHHADGVVEGERGEELIELAEHCGVERVQHLRAVEGYCGDVCANLDE